MKSIFVLGDLNVNLILSGMPDPPELGKEIVATERSRGPGGSATNVAIMLAAAGTPVRLFSRIGADADGDFLLQCLEDRQLPTDTIARTTLDLTGLTVALTYPADRMFISHLGTVVSTTLDDLPAGFIAPGAHLHLTSYYLQDGLRPDVGRLVTEAKRNGMTTSIDMGHDPRETWDISSLIPSLPDLDWFLPNDDEIIAITDQPDMVAALDAFPSEARGIVVKASAEGAFSRVDGRIEHHPGAMVPVVDTTGAGDSFNAGFLSAICAGGALRDAVRKGNEFGALAVSTIGLPTAVP